MGEGGIAVLARATGRVQGVGYRDWARGRAVGLGLRGWVRNEADGSVTGLLVGPETAVEEMLTAMLQGPRFARVSKVTRAAAETGEAPAGFEVRR